MPLAGAGMNLSHLFVSFEGRISRLQFWLGTIAVTVLASVVQWALGVPIMETAPDFRGRVIAFVIGLISLYPTIAIAVKRLHDRNQPGTYAWLLVIAFAVALLGELFGYFEESVRVTFIGWVAVAFVAVILLAFLIELGFRRGTIGPNEYGPDPLGPKG
jgi:uncharacterized membrane protein YhaH (DUF805 family)